MEQRPGVSPIERMVSRVRTSEKKIERLRETDPEEVWALWLQFLAERKGEKDEKNALRLERIKSKIVELHNALTDNQKTTLRERVQTISMEDLALFQEAGEGIQEFHTAAKRRLALRAQIAAIDAERFARNGDMDVDEFAAIEEADLRAELAEVSRNCFDAENPDALTVQSSALAIVVAAERVKNYAKALHETGFAVTPSREKLMDKITQTLLASRRAVFLSGVSGGGKTAMIRAIARQLTGREPFEANEAAKEDIRLLYGVRLMDEKNQAYIEYGPLGRALTGKTTSKEKDNGHGGVFYLDEANGLRASDLRELIKLLSGKKPGDTIQFSALGGHDVVMAPGFRFVMAGNLKSAKHTDRTELPPEVVRDMETIDIPAMPQHETYQLLLAELVDQNGRIRASQKDVAPYRNNLAHLDGTFSQEIDEAEEYGGALWRFSKLVTKIQDAFANEDPAKPRLFGAVLDIGKALSWVKSYRKLGQRTGEPLGTFLRTSFREWQASVHSEEDRATIERFFNDVRGGTLSHFSGSPEPSALPMSTKDLGSVATYSDILVTPSTPKAPEPGALKNATGKSGEVIIYNPESSGAFEVGKKYINAEGSSIVLIFEGIEKDSQNLVFLLQKSQYSLVFPQDATHSFIPAPEPIPPKGKERPLGVAEKEMKNLLGKYFLGIEAAEVTCSFDGGKKKLLSLSSTEKQQASEALRAKLAEPDVKKFVERLNTDPAEKEKWMLIYVPQKNIAEKLDDHGSLSNAAKPLAIQNLAQILNKDAQRQTPPVNIVYEAESRSQPTGFFGKNTFATEQIPSGWHFVSKTVLAGTTSKITADQKTALFTEADRLGFARGKWKQTPPALRFFALISNYKNNGGERLMQDVYDRSDIATASGLLAYVGYFDAGGLGVRGLDDGAFSLVGASLSR